MQQKNVYAVAVCLCFVLTSFSAYGKGEGKGSSPNGKPFIAIQEQIGEVQGSVASLQDQINSLVGRVDTMEDRVTADEEAILLLQTRNAELQDQLSALDEDNASIQAQITNNSNLIQVLEAEIERLEASLARKQNIVTGRCPDENQVLQQINPDGTVVCGYDDGSGGASITGMSAYAIAENILPLLAGEALATCPAGWTAIGGGYQDAFGIEVGDSYLRSDGYYVQGRNLSLVLLGWFVARVDCISIQTH